MSVLYGIHDAEGAQLVPPGGWCVALVALSEDPQAVDYAAIRHDINWIVRLNWGYGSTGTIPLPAQFAQYAARAAQFVARSNGASIFIVGNEPNHEQERPNGVYITPAQYADCFIRTRNAIKGARSSARIIPAPCAPYHANPVPWTDYWREVLETIARSGGCDGIAIHAYTRSSDPADIVSHAKMGPPLQDQYSGFLTYRDAIAVIPPSMRHLPVYITEFNELLPDGWDNRNSGVVQAAYAEIDQWNQMPNLPRVQCLALYRWPRHDKWHIEGKQGVIDDFQQAIGRGYQSPPLTGTDAAVQEQETFIPVVSSGPQPPQLPALPPREWDERLTARSVTVETPSVAPGSPFWRVVKAQWFDEQQAGGRHHIYVEAPDGTRLRAAWPNGFGHFTANGRGGFDAGNFPMSKSLNEFSVWVDDGTPSEVVKGIGMGANGNSGIHTSTLLRYERVTMPQVEQPSTPQQPATVSPLVHPVANPALRLLSQGFGVNPDRYAKFGMAGHNGVDYAVPVNTEIRAAATGQVVESRLDADGYGEYVKMRHPWGETLYAHLRTRKVEAGETINAGQVVGLSGNTGNSTGPHLHFGLRIHPYVRGWPYDGYSDPLPYLTTQSQPTQPTDVLAVIRAAAQEFGVDPDLLLSQAWAESSFDPRAVSHAGAQGLLQIMPATWAEWSPKIGAGSDPFNAAQNARVGAAYLKWLLSLTGNNPYQALIAYGWGIGNWQGDKPRPAEWIAYANKIVHGSDLLKAVSA